MTHMLYSVHVNLEVHTQIQTQALEVIHKMITLPVGEVMWCELYTCTCTHRHIAFGSYKYLNKASNHIQ